MKSDPSPPEPPDEGDRIAHIQHMDISLIDWRSLGGVVRELRQRRGLTQEQLARESGLNHSYVSQIEHGMKDNVSLKAIGGLAEALGLSPHWLILLALKSDQGDTSIENLQARLRNAIRKRLGI